VVLENSSEVLMPAPYSDDLRTKAIEAIQRGERKSAVCQMLKSSRNTLNLIWADPEVTRFLPSRGVPIPKENIEKVLQSFIHHWQRRGYGVWAIVENGSSQMVGYCGLRYLDELNEVEVLYGLARAYWGRGIALKA
jgi:RimJ/RimL family protein N-acetyltransferase